MTKLVDTASVHAELEKNGGIGVALEIEAEVYHSTNAISHSMLRHMRQSARKFKWEQDHRRPPSTSARSRHRDTYGNP